MNQSEPVIKYRVWPPKPQVRPARRQTLRSLIPPVAIAVLALVILLSLAFSIGWANATLLTGFIGAALSLAARPFVNDLLSSFNIIFEDIFDIGEKVEIQLATSRVEGVIERVNVRTTALRASTGELYIVPNGEIGVVRNFSRGRFSTANLKLKIAATDLSQALVCLKESGQEVANLLPNLLEPWQIISESGTIGKHVELTVLARAHFGQAAEVRPRLLALVQERLAEAGITLVD
jgi:moderate conductance mechanosensitive channel